MSRLIESYKVLSVEDQAKGQAGYGELDDNDWVYVDDPQQPGMATAMKVSTLMATGNPADELAIVTKARAQGLNCDRFLKKHPLQK